MRHRHPPIARGAYAAKPWRDGRLVKDIGSERFRLGQDVAFCSPSSASCFVGGRSDNGWATWREKVTGQSYKDWTAAEVAATLAEAAKP